MSLNADEAAFCGIYCGDCMGRTGVVADAASALVDVLERHEFGRTAAGVFPNELGDYDRILEAMRFMSGLRCPAVCRAREEAPDCAVWRCCTGRGIPGCYACGGFETCETLRGVLGELHGRSAMRNLRDIRETGLDAWLKAGTPRHPWDE